MVILTEYALNLDDNANWFHIRWFPSFAAHFMVSYVWAESDEYYREMQSHKGLFLVEVLIVRTGRRLAIGYLVIKIQCCLTRAHMDRV